jgi:hypothetical protein
MKIRFAFGIDRWQTINGKNPLLLISGDIGNRFAGVNQLGVVFDRISLIVIEIFVA